MVTLRPYQQAAVQAVLDARARGLQRVLYTAPTGTGKTVTFVALRAAFPMAKGREKTLVLAHREELLEQAAQSFHRADPTLRPDIEQGSRRASPWADVIVASVQTVGRPDSKRLEWLREQVALVICDEAHHAPAAGYVRTFERFGCYEDGGPMLVGCTATPKRLDGLGLNRVFEEQVYSYSIREAIEHGFLCDVRGYRVKSQVDLSSVKTVAGDYSQTQLAQAVNVEARTDAAIRHWQEVASDRPTIVFCVDVQHARDVAEAWRNVGVAAEHVDGSMAGDERRAVLARFKNGRTQVLTNVEVLTEGFDHPPTSCVVMLRPTQSWALYCQCVGRGTRIAPGKGDLLVIDVVDNCAKHSLATVPALLDLPAGMDLQGHSIREAARKLEELGARAAVLETYQPQMFSDLQTMLEQVDLLAAVETPAEVRDANCRLNWLKLPDGSYYVNCGGREVKREARLTRDLLGTWTFTMLEADRVVSQGQKPADATPKELLWLCDGIVRKKWPESTYVAAADAPWRKNPPTERQIRALRKFRVSPEILAALDRGTASAMLDQCIAQANATGGRRTTAA